VANNDKLAEAGLQEQVHNLQSELAFQADTVQALNDALAAQQQELMQLRRQLEWLHQRVREQQLQEPQSTQADEPPPPHY